MAEVDDYIAEQPERARTVLTRMWARALELVPDAEQGSSYGMAALRYRDRPLLSVVVTKAGYSVFPFSPEVVAGVVPMFEGSSGITSTKGGIRFTEDSLLPQHIFDRLVRDRRDEIDTALGGKH